MGILNQLIHPLNKEQKILQTQLKYILGFSPGYLPFYENAITHRSVADVDAHNNERLEFLGDAYIGSIVGAYLFKKYPTKDEGFLTEMRSKIVSRHSLNEISVNIGLSKLVRYNFHDKILKQSNIFGNAFEALVGAIYLDKGYNTTQTFLVKTIIGNYINLDELEQVEYNYKNRLQTWAQNNNKKLDINLLKESFTAGRHTFEMGVYIDDELIASAIGYNKKDAGQSAAEKALAILSTLHSNT